MKECLLDCGAENALMSGSGPTVFGIFKEEETNNSNIEKENFLKRSTIAHSPSLVSAIIPLIR